MTPRSNDGRRFQLIIAVLLCLESGLVLLTLPWSVLWDRNWWVFGSEMLQPVLLNNYLRGAISGLGLLTLWVGCGVATDLLRMEPAPAEPLNADSGVSESAK